MPVGVSHCFQPLHREDLVPNLEKFIISVLILVIQTMLTQNEVTIFNILGFFHQTSNKVVHTFG